MRIRTRLAPLLLVVVSLALTASFGRVWRGDFGAATAPWWVFLLLTLLAIAMLALAAAVSIEPDPQRLRIALGGIAVAWFAILFGIFATWDSAVRFLDDPVLLMLLMFGDAGAIFGLALTTGAESSLDEHAEQHERVVLVAAVGAAIVVAVVAAITAAGFLGTVAFDIGPVEDRGPLPWIAFVTLIALPPLVFGLASFASHRAAGGTFYAQAAANRRNSLLLLVALIGIAAATVEVITVSLTFDPVPALGAAGIAILVGIAAAIGADRFGSGIILDSAGAKRADPRRDRELVTVVGELALAANIPVPAIYVIEDGSENAFATGRDPAHASVAVTRGLLKRMDREELQGVIGHELGHVRNLDTRYALYIAVFVGLVAIVTDGFLRIIVRAWREGLFLRGKKKAFMAGVLLGIFLLIVALLLRLLAPLFAALVQAATSREREYLADATSVEFTRNPRALERALTALARDTDTLEAANRGTQHLWFRNPVREGSDRRTSLFATHPSLGARIDRLRALQGLDPLDPDAASVPAAET